MSDFAYLCFMVVHEVFCRVVQADGLFALADLAMALEACRACPRYGRRWGCPPFTSEGMDAKRFDRLAVAGLAVDRDTDLRLLRAAVEPELLRFEAEWGGRAAALPGDCPYCRTEAECARLLGEPCRHAESVRPSLEALGIDVMGLARRAFGRVPQWDGPEMMLICGVFFSGGESCQADQLSAAISSAVGRLASVSRRRES